MMDSYKEEREGCGSGVKADQEKLGSITAERDTLRYDLSKIYSCAGGPRHVAFLLAFPDIDREIMAEFWLVHTPSNL